MAMGAPPCRPRRPLGRIGRCWRLFPAPVPFTVCRTSAPPSLAIPGPSPGRSPGTGRRGRRHGPLPRQRLGRCAGCGSRKFADPPADGRSAIRGAGISPIAGSSRPKAAPIAPAIAGWPIAGPRRGRGKARMSVVGPARPPVGDGCPEGPQAIAYSQTFCQTVDVEELRILHASAFFNKEHSVLIVVGGCAETLIVIQLAAVDKLIVAKAGKIRLRHRLGEVLL